jgi:carboxylesterase
MTGERDEILMHGTSGDAVLLLHGLAGTPNELHVLGGQIHCDGHTVLIPLLPGRGGRGPDLNALSWEDWMRSALRAYDRLAAEHARVVVGGLSSGGTMALDVALRRPAAALLLYAAALSIRLRAAYLTPYLWRFAQRWRSPGDGLADQWSESPVPVYGPVRMRAVAELVRGMRRVRPRLREIRAPALVMHAVGDRFVSHANAHELARELGGEVELAVIEGSSHAITAGLRRSEVARRSRLFLGRTLSPGQP